MRILLVTPMPPRRDAPGAIPMVLDAQIAGLRHRHELTLVTVVGDEPGELEAVDALRVSGVEVIAVDARRPAAAGARWRRRWRLASTWATTGNPWRTVWFAAPGVQHAIDRVTRLQPFDLIAVEDSSMGVFRFPTDVPRVLTEHEVRRPRPTDWRCGSPANWPSWAFRELDWRRWPAYQLRVWRHFDVVQVFGQRDAAAVAAIAPDVLARLRVTPFGIDLPERADPAREVPGTVLFMGNFAHPPNVDAARWLVAEIMPSLRACYPGVRVLLVGRGSSHHAGHLASDDVLLLGEVPTIAPQLDAAAVVVAPVRTGGGMRMKVLRAMACGKAVVTTPRGAEGFMLGDVEPPFVIAGDADAFAAATADLLSDIESRRALAERAAAFVTEHYSAEAYGRRLEAVHQEAVTRRRSSDRRILDRQAPATTTP